MGVADPLYKVRRLNKKRSLASHCRFKAALQSRPHRDMAAQQMLP
jgi:hypothetical protein